MDKFDDIELTMLTSELQRAVTYMTQDPEAVKEIAKVLMNWSHANETERREIYKTWRNK